MQAGSLLLVFVMAGLTAVVSSSVVTRPPAPTGQVLSVHVAATSTPAPEPTLTPTPSQRPTPRPTRIPTPRPTKIPTPTSVPQPIFTSEQIYHLIDQYAGQYHVDPNVLRRIAVCETGFNPKSTNHIYAGLFQYDAPTWKSFRKLQGLDQDPNLRFNAEEAIRTTAYLLSQNRAYLWPNCAPR